MFPIFNVSRPRFWIYLLGPFFIGGLIGAKGRGDLLHPLYLLFAVYFTFPANLLVYGVNDIFDYETDKLNPKKQGYEVLVTEDRRPLLWKWIACTNLPFLMALPWLSHRALAALAAFLFLSFFYSAPPIRAKARPILDSAFNILYYMPALVGLYILAQPGLAWNLLLAASLWCMAMHAYSAVPDTEQDLQAGVHTVATLLGPTLTLVLCGLFYLASGILSFPQLGWVALVGGALYVWLVSISLRTRGTQFLKVYRFFPLVNAGIGGVISLSLIAAKFLR